MKSFSIYRFGWSVSIVGSLLFAAVPNAHAHGDKHAGQKNEVAISKEEKAFGMQGEIAKVNRTVVIHMHDSMRFSPAAVTIKQGETIRFVVKNKGKILHEIVLGTLQGLKEHGELMKKFPDMEHDEPYMAHVKPGDQQEIIWRFTNAGEFYFGCLLPGHFDAGMIGKITVKKG